MTDAILQFFINIDYSSDSLKLSQPIQFLPNSSMYIPVLPTISNAINYYPAAPAFCRHLQPYYRTRSAVFCNGGQKLLCSAPVVRLHINFSTKALPTILLGSPTILSRCFPASIAVVPCHLLFYKHTHFPAATTVLSCEALFQTYFIKKIKLTWKAFIKKIKFIWKLKS